MYNVINLKMMSVRSGLGSITIHDYDHDYDYMSFLLIDYDHDYDYSSLQLLITIMIMITWHQKLSITILITLYFLNYDYDYDYISHIAWLQSRLRVIKIIWEILIDNNEILLQTINNNNCNWNLLTLIYSYCVQEYQFKRHKL